MRRAATGALLVLLAACARPQVRPPIMMPVYDCSENESTADGSFSADPNGVRWHRDLEDGMSISLGLSLAQEEQEEFATRGFAGRRFDHPITFVEFDDRFSGTNYWRRGVPHMEVAGEIRIGDRAVRQWMPVNMVASATWSKALWLLEGKGDMVVTLYNRQGVTLQRASLRHDTLIDVENVLKSMHARVMKKLAQKETLCRSELMPFGGDTIWAR